MDDEPGLLSVVLQTIALSWKYSYDSPEYSDQWNRNSTLSVDILPGEGDAEAMVEEIESQEGIHYLKILGRE